MMPGMSDVPKRQRSGSVPVIMVPQCVPSRVCLACKVCCRFPEQDSFLRPYFTDEEIERAIKEGMEVSSFPDLKGSQIRVVPNPSGDGYLCPAFDPETFHCRIYEHRPLDCKIYPFTLMWNGNHTAVTLGWDRKCPFMVNDATQRDDADTLLPEMTQNASDIQELLESDQVVDLVLKNPQLITRFQDDVVILGILSNLTTRLIRSDPVIP